MDNIINYETILSDFLPNIGKSKRDLFKKNIHQLMEFREKRRIQEKATTKTDELRRLWKEYSAP